MRSSIVTAGLLALASSVVYGMSTAHIQPFEKLRSVPEGWKEVGAPEPSRRLKFRIAVHQVGIQCFTVSGMYSPESKLTRM
jgi:tripeptidyl-peptidase-1